LAIFGAAVFGIVGIFRWLLRHRSQPKPGRNIMTIEQLEQKLDAGGLPRTLAGLVALRGTNKTEAIAWLRLQAGDLRETAEVLADPDLIAQIAEAEEDRAAGRPATLLSEVRHSLGGQQQ